MRYTFICYERCSTCIKALKHLEMEHIEFDKRSIKEENPTRDELIRWSQESGIPLRKFFNTSGKKYKELELSKKMDSLSEEEKLDLLASDGMLVKRPILVGNQRVIVGYKKEIYDELKIEKEK